MTGKKSKFYENLIPRFKKTNKVQARTKAAPCSRAAKKPKEETWCGQEGVGVTKQRKVRLLTQKHTRQKGHNKTFFIKKNIQKFFKMEVDFQLLVEDIKLVRA